MGVSAGIRACTCPLLVARNFEVQFDVCARPEAPGFDRKVLYIVESTGTALALPTQVTHLVQDSDSNGLRRKDRFSPRDLNTTDELQFRR
jgi:hypothetical protein